MRPNKKLQPGAANTKGWFYCGQLNDQLMYYYPHIFCYMASLPLFNGFSCSLVGSPQTFHFLLSMFFRGGSIFYDPPLKNCCNNGNAGTIWRTTTSVSMSKSLSWFGATRFCTKTDQGKTLPKYGLPFFKIKWRSCVVFRTNKMKEDFLFTIFFCSLKITLSDYRGLIYLYF